jgi:hypothetical protein
LVSLEKGKEVQTLDIPETGLVVYLKELGWVKLFCQDFKNEARYYVCYQPDLEALKILSKFLGHTSHSIKNLKLALEKSKNKSVFYRLFWIAQYIEEYFKKLDWMREEDLLSRSAK